MDEDITMVILTVPIFKELKEYKTRDTNRKYIRPEKESSRRVFVLNADNPALILYIT